MSYCYFFFFQAEDGIRDLTVTGVQTCALPICSAPALPSNSMPPLLLPGMASCFLGDRKSTRLNSSHSQISYAVFCLKKKTRAAVSSAARSVHPTRATACLVAGCITQTLG